MKAEEAIELEPIFTIAIDLHAALYALISGTLITSFLVRRLQRSPPAGHSALFCGLQCGSTTAICVLLVTHKPHVFSRIHAYERQGFRMRRMRGCILCSLPNAYLLFLDFASLSVELIVLYTDGMAQQWG